MLGCVVLLLLLGTACSTPKKGFGMNYVNFNCNDENTLSDATWWYDWKPTPDEVVRHGCHQSKEYVPMIWGWNSTGSNNLNIPSSAKYVLGFNEPNQKDQSNVSPQEAARHWPEIERHAQNKLLVSPSPSGCNGGSNCNMNSTLWLDEFFKACQGCRVDFIAAHTYSCNADHDMRYLEKMYNRYKKKVWLTEFGCPHTSHSHILNYMKQILPRLENAHFVYRYAWFITRWKDDGFLTTATDLLQLDSSASKLTALGQYYNNFRHK
ncbi:alkali-sensitive linkage protein 1-like isoform X2 [Haliotis rufescens]|nr:alkali-sensitive linkage protein 1-like isoform X2 [Haliotis rufescens]